METVAVQPQRVEPLSSSMKQLAIPEIAVKLALGAKIGRSGDQGAIRFEGEEIRMHGADLDLAIEISKKVLEKTPRKITPGAVITMVGAANKILSDKIFRPDSIRVLYYAVESKASAFYRCIMPMYALNMSGKAVSQASVMRYGRESLNYDVIVLQIADSPSALEFMTALQNEGKKVVYEIDDAFHKLEPWHPQFASYGQPERHEAVKAMMRQADAVQVSTQWLADEYRQYARRIEVIPNMVELATWPPTERARKDGLWKVLWAGSSSHSGDLQIVVPALAAFAKLHPNVRIVFFGQSPPGSDIPKEQIEVIDWCEFEEYPVKFSGVDADVAIAPLADVPFNYGKSNLRVLQCWASKYPVIASNVGPYAEAIRHGSDGLLCEEGGWLASLEKTYQNEDLCKRFVDAGLERAKEFDVRPNIKKILSFYSSLKEK